jgi:hypothetical protein
MLGATMAERTLLGLRTIGAVDCRKEERKQIAMQQKREADRTRAAAKRAAAGARPRGKSYSAIKPWEGFRMSRRSFYRLADAERAAMLEQAIAERGTEASPIIYADPLTRDEVVPGESAANSLPPSNVIRLPLRQAAGFCRAHPGVRIGSPGWREAFDAWLAGEQSATEASPSASPSSPPEGRALEHALADPPPSEEIARLDWWRQPVPGWREGRLEIRSLLTGESTVIRLSDGEILRHPFGARKAIGCPNAGAGRSDSLDLS